MRPPDFGPINFPPPYAIMGPSPGGEMASTGELDRMWQAEPLRLVNPEQTINGNNRAYALAA